MPIKRKTLAETKAEYRLLGFMAAQEPFLKEWRARVHKNHNDPVAAAMWEVLRFVDCETSRLNAAVLRLSHPRQFGSDPSEFTWTCQCGSPEKHSAR